MAFTLEEIPNDGALSASDSKAVVNRLAKKETKYFVLKIKDVEGMLTETEQEILACIIGKLDNVNEYIICNADEPYAENVWQAILDGEDAKAC